MSDLQHLSESGDDFLLAWSYANGELSPVDESAFEDRLEHEADLAEQLIAAVQLSEAADLLARNQQPALQKQVELPALRRSPASHSRSRPLAVTAACLACLCVLLFAAIGPSEHASSRTETPAVSSNAEASDFMALLSLYQFQSSLDADSEDVFADADYGATPEEIDVPEWLLVAVELDGPAGHPDGGEQFDDTDDRELF